MSSGERCPADPGPWKRSPVSDGWMWGDRSRWQNRARPLVWLIFLAAPLSGIFHGNRTLSPVHIALVSAVTGLFVLTWAALNLFRDERRDDFPRWSWGLLSLWFMGIVTFLSYYDAGYWAYVYIFSLFPAIRFTRKGIPTVLGFTALTALVTTTSGLTPGNVWGPVATVGGGGLSAVAFWRLTTTNHELRKARDDLARIAVAEERLRFARDLHDLLGHSLSVITLKSEVAGRLLPDSVERARTEVGEIEAIAREALREVREAVTGYRQATVAVEVAGARTALAAAGIAWSEDIQIPDLSAEAEGPLAWAVREGVTNVIRHSGASRCRLTIRREGDFYVATVTDDGPGPPGADVEGADEGAGAIGNGIRGLGERLALAGGTLDAGGMPGGGYRLRAAVPRSAPPAPVETIPGPPPEPVPQPVQRPVPQPVPQPGAAEDPVAAGRGRDRR